MKSTAGIQKISVKTYAQQLASMFKDTKNVLQNEAPLALDCWSSLFLALTLSIYGYGRLYICIHVCV